jgi:hypothetical protein
MAPHRPPASLCLENSQTIIHSLPLFSYLNIEMEEDILSCYRTLDLDDGASVESVREAYLALAHVWDPDKHVSNPPLRLIAEQRRREIDRAYNALMAFLPDPRQENPTAAPLREADVMDSLIIETGAPKSQAVSVMVGLVLLIVFLFSMVLLSRSWNKLSPTVPRSVESDSEVFTNTEQK